MTFIRSLIFNILFYFIGFFVLIVISILGPFLPCKFICKTLNNLILPFLKWLLYIICGTKIEVRGKENIVKGGAIYASKHQSAMETFFITSIVKGDATYIFKKELTYIPFFGWAVKAYGSIPIDRNGGSSAMRKMLSVAKHFLERGRSIIIFPEGTRTKIGETKDYKPGIAFMYQNINVPVVPIALNTGFFWPKGSFLRPSGKVIIEFMKPINKNLDKKEFIDILQNTIESKCAEINAETIKNYPKLIKYIKK